MMVISGAIENFLYEKESYCLVRTVSDYKEFLYRFLRYTGDIELDTLTEDMVFKYIRSINQSGLSTATKGTYIRNLKIFLRWCKEEYGYVLPDINLSKIKEPKYYQKRVHILSDSEVKALFDAVHTVSKKLTIRNKLIIALMYDSGLRQMEVVNLTWECIDFNKKEMLIRGKGDKERIVPIGKVSDKLLSDYREFKPEGNTYVFLDRRGEHITNNTIKLFMQKLKNITGIPVSSHKLRHNFATNFLLDQYNENRSFDTFSLMVIMGHEDIITTNKYLHEVQKIIAAKSYKSHLDMIAV